MQYSHFVEKKTAQLWTVGEINYGITKTFIGGNWGTEKHCRSEEKWKMASKLVWAWEELLCKVGVYGGAQEPLLGG